MGGFEPPTPCAQGTCATKLRYTLNCISIIYHCIDLGGSFRNMSSFPSAPSTGADAGASARQNLPPAPRTFHEGGIAKTSHDDAAYAIPGW